MTKKPLLMALLSFLALTIVPQVANAATITSVAPTENTYKQGDACALLVTIFNDKNAEIRVTQLSATIDYYKADGVRYVQRAFTDTELPDQIQMGESTTYQILVNLPDDVASGYTNPRVEASTEIWRSSDSKWVASDYLNSDYLTSKPKIYIESPYKQMYDASQQTYKDQLGVNSYLTNMMNLFIITTVVFAGVAGILFFVLRKAKPMAMPLPST